MRIEIIYESVKIPDYRNGETVADTKTKLLDIEFDGETTVEYSEFMDKVDKKHALSLIKSILKTCEEKINKEKE